MKTFFRVTLSFTYICFLIAQMPTISEAQPEPDELAVVNKQAISTADLKPYLPPGFESLDPDKAAAVQKIALENAITSLLLKAEARRRKISVPTLRRLMTAGTVRVPNSQVEDEFLKNLRYFGLLSTDEAKERLRLHLEVDEHMKFYRAALSKLRARAKVEVRLRPPQLRTISLSGSGPSDGRESARVTITMFSDFQCRYCQESQLILAEILDEYPDDVRLVFRHFPLAGVSPGLSPSSAAVCADQQGSFWEYHDAAYVSQPLTNSKLTQIAVDLDLNLDRFEQCIASSTPISTINSDVAEARQLGITGTPTFIVNGKLYKGKLEFWQFKELVESELAFSSRTQQH